MFRINQTYNTFISHSWDYHQDYEKLKEWLGTSIISIRDYSIPIEKKLDVSGNRELKERITSRIGSASVVIILAGMYANYSEWIDYEINEAIRMHKPILGVYPRGQERTPIKITSAANVMVHWNSESFVRGFKKII